MTERPHFHFLQEFPGGLVVRILGFHYHGPDSIPGWGIEIPEATQHGPKKKVIMWGLGSRLVIVIFFSCYGKFTFNNYKDRVFSLKLKNKIASYSELHHP